MRRSVSVISSRSVRNSIAFLASNASRVASAWRAIVVALDVAIALYAVALLLVLITGGFEIGFLSVRQAAKPILVLWLLVPIRLALHFVPATGPVARRVIAVPPAVRDVAFAFGVTRLAATSVGFLVNILYPMDRTRPFALPFENAKLAETFAAWDSGWYFDIARQGYYYSAEGQSSIAFFPLYPLAMRALAWPFGSSDAALWTAGIAISCAAFLFGLLVLHRMTHQVFGDREIARRTVLYVCVFPFSFFLSRVYPSGLFFLLTVLAVSSARQSRWVVAGLCGALAALTRPQGILIAVPLALMAIHGARGRQLLWRAVALTPIGVAFLGFNLYIGSLAGHRFGWLEGERSWGFSLGHPPWEQLLSVLGKLERYGLYDYFFTSTGAPYHLFHGVAALVLLAATPAVFARLGLPLGAYVLVSLLVPLSGSGLEGIGRYGTVLFPVFMVMATVKSPRFHEAMLIVGSLFLALFIGLFVTWRPIY
jgi:hypothetical protein